MRTKLISIATLVSLSVLAPAGLALAHTENPGNACNNPVPQYQNPNCDTATLNGSSQSQEGDGGNGNAPGNGHDNDGDGRPARWDNCPDVYNPNQVDTDDDGLGDSCDHADDTNGDGTCDTSEEMQTI